MEEKPVQSLVDVVQAALALMMAIQIFGLVYDSYQPKKLRTVPCSVSIENMARKLNITLQDYCQVTD